MHRVKIGLLGLSLFASTAQANEDCFALADYADVIRLSFPSPPARRDDSQIAPAYGTQTADVGGLGSNNYQLFLTGGEVAALGTNPNEAYILLFAVNPTRWFGGRRICTLSYAVPNRNAAISFVCTSGNQADWSRTARIGGLVGCSAENPKSTLKPIGQCRSEPGPC